MVSSLSISESGRVSNPPPRSQVEDRLQFEKLLSDISAELMIATPDRVGGIIKSALEAVRCFFKVDRCGILAVSDAKDSWSVDYAVYGEGIPVVSGEINLALLFPWITQQVVFENNPVVVTNLEEMPSEAAVDRASCDDMGIVSFVNIPIRVGITRQHLLVLNSLRQTYEWPKVYIPRLRLLGEMLVNTIERTRASDLACKQGARVAAAVDAAELGFVEWTPGTEQPYLDNQLRNLLGIDAPDSEKANELWLARVHAEDRPTLSENRRRLLAGEIERASIEYRYDHPRRGLIWLRQSSRRHESEPDRSARIIEAIEDVTERADRIAFETLLSNISAQLIVVGSEQLEAIVLSALHAVRLFFGADRCALCNISDNQQKVDFAHIALGEGVSNVLGELDLGALFPWLRKRLVVEGEYVAMSRLSELPPEAARDRETFEARGTRSLLCVPIQVGSKWSRLILLSVVHNEVEWPQEYIPRLRLLGQMLVNTIERTRAQDLACERAATVAAAVEAAELGLAEWHLGSKRPFLGSRFCDLLGMSSEDDIEKVMGIWFARAQADMKASLTEDFRQLQAKEIECARREYQYNHPLRGLIWLRHSLRRLDAEDGGSARIIVAVEDVTVLRRALESAQLLRERLEHENVYLQKEIRQRVDPEGIVGQSTAIRHTLALAEQVASTDSTVLLLGETGVGKERFASYIHDRSRRRNRPMIRINCSAIPPSLIESELFGREKGAYTGALSKQIGRFELANGSTLFLDEIGELPADLQVKLLRVLESHTIERLGSPKPIHVDIRIIAATNCDLAAQVRDGKFRHDLYYRLNVFPLSIPPLRERPEDIPLFIDAFVDELAVTMGKRIEEVDAECVAAMEAYPWPGNVRELRNLVERAIIMANGPRLRIDLPETYKGLVNSSTELTSAERAHILDVLNSTGWRVRGTHGAAERLGLRPTTLESRMKKLGVARPGI